MWASQNPEKVYALNHRWYLNHKEEHLKRTRLRQLTHKEQEKERLSRSYQERRNEILKKQSVRNKEHRQRLRNETNDWRRSNPEKVREYRTRRRARKLGAVGNYTREEVHNLLEWQDGKCLYCGINIESNWTEDHYIPLILGGENDIHNIVLCCKSCNSSKQDKLPWLWDQRLM